jgi:hypothetical protein
MTMKKYWFRKGVARWMMTYGQGLAVGLLRWLSVGTELEAPPGLRARPTEYISPEGSPFTPFAISAAVRLMRHDPNLQRDLNACLECLHLDFLAVPLRSVYTAAMLHTGDAEEAFRQLAANAIVLGYAFGRMSERATEEIPMAAAPAVSDSEF